LPPQGQTKTYSPAVSRSDSDYIPRAALSKARARERDISIAPKREKGPRAAAASQTNIPEVRMLAAAAPGGERVFLRFFYFFTFTVSLFSLFLFQSIALARKPA
jgi:hypothetical protein